jgi:hypothetical protein
MAKSTISIGNNKRVNGRFVMIDIPVKIYNVSQFQSVQFYPRSRKAKILTTGIY